MIVAFVASLNLCRIFDKRDQLFLDRK